jgi:[calcium/calmodulin-dependent protein kinase] kinase
VPLVETDRIVEELDLQAERRRVNQYTLLRVLGEGTSGTVHYAQHTADGKREFAVKEISKGRLKKRFMRKAHSRSASLHSLMLLPQSTSSPSSASMQSIGGVLRTSPASNNNNNNSNINNNNDNNNNRQFLRINNGGGGGQITINPDGWQRELKRELKVLKRLQQCPAAGPHPNIIRLYEVMDDPDVDSLFMVFEYCPNGPVVKISCLSNTSKSTSSASPPMTEGRARYLFRQLSLAINFSKFPVLTAILIRECCC